MTLKDLLIQITVKFVLAALFFYFAVDGVIKFGWGFVSILSVIFATNNIVQGIRMLSTYFKIKKNIDKK
ncbi:DUF4305 domain-containing protein [Jeotgalibaca sp. MA1X17-3]|uniref:DUF4305 domain-containing protein n=1 Tax=Jeotgalibaca sp. MA1X17-3 TaxID=2908211 RepID=UPI001F3D401C|nr:DUF4305 domain-containing protein [Jeotgalibaca sp. MA1X17-3]UJF15525.1 DUF4305 domain-containing protein [Jeotgalibaca sp. MA1X17-3]